MRKKLVKLSLQVIAIMVVVGSTSYSDNPIIQTIYTADPAPVVRDGVCYLYTSHGEDVLVNNFFTMKDWRCFSSTDMVNWTDHGAVASLYDFKWANSGWGGGFENGAWAVQCIELDGKWYLYCPLQGRGIGVLVADNPFGPFTDPIGKPLIGGNHIDPTVLIDDDGQAYLYWGNPKCWYVRLNRDMISYDTGIGDNGLVVLDMFVEEFGKRSKEDERRATTYEEGPWTYGGVVMTPQSAFTIHPGVVDFKGKTYLFYHDAGLPGGGGFNRSVCVDELEFKSDGSVKKVEPTKDGASQVGHLDPYKTVQAETICWTGGVETEKCDEGGMNVCDIDDGDFIKVKGVDFGSGASLFGSRVASADKGGKVELRLNSQEGTLIGTCTVSKTGGAQKWENASCKVEGASGIHDLYLVFKGDPAGHLFNVDSWTFEKKGDTRDLAAASVADSPREHLSLAAVRKFHLGDDWPDLD